MNADRNGAAPAGQPATPSPAAPGNRDDLGLSGPDRVRRAIARDRGFYAPNRPVVLCGDPQTAWTGILAGQPRPLPRLTRRQRLAVRLGDLLLCPDCLGLRFGPVHLALKITRIH